MTTLHNVLAQSHPKLARGRVWCTECGIARPVDPADALRNGWPKHCGLTMTIDSPAERAALTATSDAGAATGSAPRSEFSTLGEYLDAQEGGTQ